MSCCNYCTLKKGGECKYLLEDLDKSLSDEEVENAYLFHDGVRIPECEDKFYDYQLMVGEQ